MGDVTPIRASKSTVFEEFISAYLDSLFHRACRLTGDQDEAEDLVQEVCIRAYDSIEELAAMNNPIGWLQRVLFHLFVDACRRENRQPTQTLDSDAADFVSALACSEPGPAEQVENELLCRALRSALKKLRPVDQALLILREVEGYSWSEITEITELPETTTKSRLNRARIRLGRLIRESDITADTKNRSDWNELPRRHRSAG